MPDFPWALLLEVHDQFSSEHPVQDLETAANAKKWNALFQRCSRQLALKPGAGKFVRRLPARTRVGKQIFILKLIASARDKNAIQGVDVLTHLVRLVRQHHCETIKMADCVEISGVDAVEGPGRPALFRKIDVRSDADEWLPFMTVTYRIHKEIIS